MCLTKNCGGGGTSTTTRQTINTTRNAGNKSSPFKIGIKGTAGFGSPKIKMSYQKRGK